MVFLECEFDGIAMDKSQWPKKETAKILSIISGPHYDVEVVSDVTLEPNERKMMQLRIFPKVIGKIKIIGLRYYVCGVFSTYFPFQSTKPLEKDDAKSINSVPADCKNDLMLRVKPSMPVLEVNLLIPDSLMAGQIYHGIMEAKNTGCRDLTNVKVVCTHPHVIFFENSNSLKDDSKILQQQWKCKNTLFDPTLSTIQLKSLAAGDCIKIPITVRASEMGVIDFKCIFGFMGTGDDHKLFQTFRLVKSIQITPLLKADAFTKTSARKMGEFLVGLEIENLLPSADVQITQIISISPTWGIDFTGEEYYIIL
jgi:hypothetical protein